MATRTEKKKVQLDGCEIVYENRSNGTWGIEVKYENGREVRMFPFMSLDMAERYLKESSSIPEKLEGLLRKNGVR